MPLGACSDGRGLEEASKSKRVKSSLPPSLEKRRIVVVGAGFAGLSAARTLQAQAGDRVDVVVLESGSCPGGRARTAELPSGTPVELGATWLHGVQGNPLYDLAVWQGLVKDVRGDQDLRRHEIDWQLHFVKPPAPGEHGELLGGRLREVALDAVYRFTEAAEECAEQEPGLLEESSVGAVLRRRFDEAVSSLGLQGEELAVFAESWWFREKLQRTFDGFFSTDDVSLAFPREFDVLDGPNMPVPGGWQALSDLLSDGLNIRYNHRVSGIEYGSGGAHVTCTNGAVFDCDAVIVTVSIGILQAKHAQLFQPPLPEWKQAAMSAVRIGVADKVFIEFDIDPAVAQATAAAQAQPPERVRSRYGIRTSYTGHVPCERPAVQKLTRSSFDGVVGGQHGSSHSGPISGTLSAGTHVSMPEDDLPHKATRPPSSTPSRTRTPPPLSATLPCVDEWQEDRTCDSGEVSSANPAAAIFSKPPTTSPSPMRLSHPTPQYGSQQHLQQLQQQLPDAPEPMCSGSATGGQPEPWNMGRRPSSRALVEDEAAAIAAEKAEKAAAATAAAAAMVPGAPRGGAVSTSNSYEPSKEQAAQQAQQQMLLVSSVSRAAEELQARHLSGSSAHASSGSGGSSANALSGHPRQKQRQVVQSYAFMWPIPEPSVLGCSGASQAAALLPGGLDPSALTEAAEAAGVPKWCLGLHSVRFSPGPEWVQPSDSQKHELARQQGLAKWQAPQTASGVFWITGEAALEMERLSDEEVTSGLTALLRAFPQIPLPKGALLPPKVLRTKWGTDEDFLGSYSYCRSGVYDGSAVDLLAEPLCSDNGLPVLMFAGEATHRQYMGTAHGAFLSGCREAGRLVEALDQIDAALAWEMAVAGAEAGYTLQPGLDLAGARCSGGGFAMSIM